MESWSVAHRALQIFCSDFWSSAEDCALILADVGIESTRINMGEPSIMRWMSIIREMMRKNDGSMGKLVTVLIRQYPENKQLADVCAPWIPSSPMKSIEAPAAPTPPPVAVPAGAVLVPKFAAAPTPAKAPTRSATTPKRQPEPIPAVVPHDFADEAGLVVPRIDTLWAAMVDIEQRMTELERWKAAMGAAQSAGGAP